MTTRRLYYPILEKLRKILKSLKRMLNMLNKDIGTKCERIKNQNIDNGKLNYSKKPNSSNSAERLLLCLT